MANKKKMKAKPKAKPKVKTKTTAKVKSKAKAKAKTNTKAKTKTKAKAKTIQVKNKMALKKIAAKKPQPSSKTKAMPVKSIDYSKAITPLGDRLVVRIVENERVTAGGLIIPDTVSQVSGFLKAKVLAVGRGTQNKKGLLKAMDVQKGDTVLFSQYAGTKVSFNSEDLQIIQETDVMGVVQD